MLFFINFCLILCSFLSASATFLTFLVSTGLILTIANIKSTEKLERNQNHSSDTVFCFVQFFFEISHLFIKIFLRNINNIVCMDDFGVLSISVKKLVLSAIYFNKEQVLFNNTYYKIFVKESS